MAPYRALQAVQVGALAHDRHRSARPLRRRQRALDSLVRHELAHEEEEVLGLAGREALELDARVHHARLAAVGRLDPAPAERREGDEVRDPVRRLQVPAAVPGESPGDDRAQGAGRGLERDLALVPDVAKGGVAGRDVDGSARGRTPWAKALVEETTRSCSPTGRRSMARG